MIYTLSKISSMFDGCSSRSEVRGHNHVRRKLRDYGNSFIIREESEDSYEYYIQHYGSTLLKFWAQDYENQYAVNFCKVMCNSPSTTDMRRINEFAPFGIRTRAAEPMLACARVGFGSQIVFRVVNREYYVVHSIQMPFAFEYGTIKTRSGVSLTPQSEYLINEKDFAALRVYIDAAQDTREFSKEQIKVLKRLQEYFDVLSSIKANISLNRNVYLINP